ncbi:MAG: CBS domain-containing protein [Clostridiaceae bacterium]
MKVENIIDTKVRTINVNDSVEKALELMTNLKINGMPVINDDGNLVGIVVKADIFRFMIAPGHYGSCPVEWVMTKSVVTTKPDEDVIKVANKLRKHNIDGIPVVENKKVVGFITIEKIVDYLLDLEEAK